jgi:hypothetical protein
MVLKLDLVRPDDLLNLKVEAINLNLVSRKGKKPFLEVEDRAQPAFLSFTFPPQTIAEHAYFEASIVKPEGNPKRPDPDPPTLVTPLDEPGHVPARLGKSSRLVFEVPVDIKIPFTIAGLTDWSKFKLSVNPIAAIGPTPTAAQIAAAPAISEPSATQTAIELPYRLIISPSAAVSWLHRPLPFTSMGRTELWHTRLVNLIKAPEGKKDQISELNETQTASLRAIWSPDFKPYPPPTKLDPDLGRSAMAPNDRHQIVILTSAFHGFEVEKVFNFASTGVNRFVDVSLRTKFTLNVPYVPQPFYARQLMLTPLGGWLKSHGNWSPPHPAPPSRPRPGLTEALEPVRFALNQPLQPLNDFARELDERAAIAIPAEPSLDLSEWVHIATEGRDHYVKVVYEGELWGFRHRAALIKITERKFKEHNGIIGAYMIQRMFIVVREPEKTYPEADRGNPLKKVVLTTITTPDIAEPTVVAGWRTFWVEVMTGQPKPARFKFDGVAYDINGNAVNFSMPMLFVSKSDYEKPAPIVTYFNLKTNIPDRNVDIPGQKVMFAKPDLVSSNTQLITQTLNYFMDLDRVQPKLLRAEVKVPQIQQLLGTDAASTIRLYPPFVANGFDAANKTAVFAQIVDGNYSEINPVDANAGLKNMQTDFRADKAGGFATPNLGISTLSRKLGPLAGKVDDAVNNHFDPSQFFPKAGAAKLFGTFDLADLLSAVSLDTNAPQMHTTIQNGGTLLVTTLDWNPEFHDKDLGIAAIKKDAGSTLTVHAEIKKSLVALAAPPTSKFTGTFTNFTVVILSSVALHFQQFQFVTETNKKPDVTVALKPDPLEFIGDLAFVQELKNALPPGLFGQGPSLDLLQNPLGIRAGFSFSLPPISVGVFALKDVSVGAALTLPFLDGKPIFDFNFCERQHPFLLTVSLFGGGGFFHLQLDTAGMKLLEAALEFGAAAAIDIGVASGEVHIMAGIYFALRRDDVTNKMAAVLSGYLRMGGSLSVLGLIKITVEFNLSFTYDSGRDKAYGRATLTVEVEVVFFSVSVELTVERAFGGSGDPHFGELFSESEMWNDYALAFA